MNGAKKGLYALSAALIIGGSMLAPIGTASAQTMTQCERFQYNWCLLKWDDPNFAEYSWDSPNDCYAELRESQCAYSSSSADPDPAPYRLHGRPVASA